ncbi:Rho-type GTPase activating protein Rga1 [Umbelopsis sp. WA50703]
METDTEEKTYQIWTVLSAFEESSAATISDMLLHVSVGKYIEGVNMAKRFIDHVHILFKAINLLNEMFINLNEPAPHFQREARDLSRKTVDFFALLSQTQESGLHRIGITQELLSLITGLANNLKSLIRIGLKSALKLEQKHGMTNAISTFLKQLLESNLRPKYPQIGASVVSSMDFKTDLCYRCNRIIEESCIRMKRYRWHNDCFACTRCDQRLADIMDSATFDLGSLTIVCNVCSDGGTEKALTCFERVSLLEQYSFLLWVSLCRLDTLLRAPDGSATLSEHSLNRYKESAPVDFHSQPFYAAGRAKTVTEGDNRLSLIRDSDLNDFKSPQPQYNIFRSTSRSSRRANTFHASNQDPHSSSIPEESGETLKLETPTSRKSGSLVKRLSQRHGRSSIFGSPIDSKFSRHSLNSAIKEKDISNYIPKPELHLGPSGLKSNPSIRRVPSITADPCRLQTYLAELSQLQYMVAKHAAVLQLEPLVNDKFSMDELLDLIEQKRENMWNKLFTSFKAHRRGIKSTITFGVPIETLLERYGVDTKLGFGPGTLRLPSFLSQSILRLKQLDMAVEGVFRKNGNIRVLQETVDSIDIKPNEQQIAEETNSIQLAALFKRFLRNLPDPLLTQKLYGLFIYSQSLNSEEDRRKALHLLCCILPQANRNCLEALSDLMQWVASFSAHNKMDLKNLATVITPNILYCKGSVPNRQEILTANHAVEMLLQHQEDFSLVPIEIEPAIHNSKITQFFEDNRSPTPRDFPKVYKRFTRKGTEFYATVPPARRTQT